MKLKEAYHWAQTEEGIQAGRAYMEKPRMMENQLTILYARMDKVRDSMESALSYGNRSGSGAPGDKTGQIASRLCDLEEEIEGLLHALAKVRAEREKRLQEIEDLTCRVALRYHFMEQMTAVAAARRMHMDERQYFRVLRKGYTLVAMQLALGKDGPGT